MAGRSRRFAPPATREAAVDRSARPRYRLLPVWALFTLVFTVLGVAWSLSTPIPSGPDEPTQYVKAAAVVRGTLTGQVPPGTKPGTANVRVPGTIDALRGSGNCYYNKPLVPASCAPATHAPSTAVESSTYIAFYPPLYSAIVGLPSLVSTHMSGLRAMRAVNAFLDSLFLGLAVALLVVYARSAWLYAGLLLAITPMTFYLLSVVNSSSLELATAAGVWVAATLLLFEYNESPPAPLVAGFCACSLFLAGTRPYSVAYLAAIVGLLLLLRPRAGARLWRHRGVRWTSAATLLASVLAVAYVVDERGYVIEHLPLPRGVNGTHIMAATVGYIPRVLKELVGGFGAPEFVAPAFALAVWFVGAGALIVAALFVLRRWYQAAILAAFCLLLFVAVPLLAQLPSVHQHLVPWQGRYSYPLAFGIPLVAAAILAERGLPLGRGVGLAALLTTCGSLVTFYWVVRRYTVGLGWNQNPLQPVAGRWLPPVPLLALFAVVAAATIAYAACTWWFAWRLPRPPLAAGSTDTRETATLPIEEAPTELVDRPPRGLVPRPGDGRVGP